jgi:hypothetical protein
LDAIVAKNSSKSMRPQCIDIFRQCVSTGNLSHQATRNASQGESQMSMPKGINDSFIVGRMPDDWQ